MVSVLNSFHHFFFIYVPQSSVLQAKYLIAKTEDLHSPPSFTLIFCSA